MDKELQAAVWEFVKERRDALIGAEQEYERAQKLLWQMRDAGLSDHLPSLEEVRAAFKGLTVSPTDHPLEGKDG